MHGQRECSVERRGHKNRYFDERAVHDTDLLQHDSPSLRVGQEPRRMRAASQLPEVKAVVNLACYVGCSLFK